MPARGGEAGAAGGRYDLVHVHTPLAPTLPLLAIDESDCPVVGTFHTQLGCRVTAYDLGRDYFQRRMDLIAAAIAVSPTAAASAGRYFRTDWTIIPNGVDLTLFRPDAPRPAALAGDTPTLLFLGRLDPRNGLGTLLKAFSRIRRIAGRAIRLVVVGGGPLRRFYEARASPDVHFVGPTLEGRPGYYAHSDVYVCPSTRASFGITLLEAMACGTPIVCSDAEGFRQVVTDGREAFVAPIADVDAFAEALVTLLDDATLRAQMGAAGRRRALEFGWPRVAEQVVDVYHRVLGLPRESWAAASA
jgi:phosphatidyl-myo-inositol alpha-mannosyltransferase